MSRRFTAPVAPRAPSDPDPFYQIALKEGALRTSQEHSPAVAERRPISRMPLSARRESLSSRHLSADVQSSPIPPPPAREPFSPSAQTPQKYSASHLVPRNSVHTRNVSADFTARDSRMRDMRDMRDLNRSVAQKGGITPPTLSTAILDAPLGARRASAAVAPQSAVVPPTQSDMTSYTRAAPPVPQSAHPLRFGSSRRPSTSFDTSARETSPLRSQADGTESVVSTTAPSTVWDELGELKSRIRKLELTGKPRKPGTAMPQSSYTDLNERPRTSTTQTTNDTSPLLSQHASPMGLSTESSELHPLLRQALGKAKSRLDASIYKYLEAVAFDALELASMARGSEVPDSASVFTSNTNAADPRLERRMRRKADNVCRGLTELSISLCEGKAAGDRGAPSRPVSRDNVSHYSRGSATGDAFGGYSPDARSHLSGHALERRPSERLRSRFQARRGSGTTKSEFLDETSPTRGGSHRRNSQHASSDFHVNGDDPTLQPMPARAMTEIANHRTQTSNTAASAYASKHMLAQSLGTPTSHPNDGASNFSRSSSTARTARRQSLRVEASRADDEDPRASGYSLTFSPGDDKRDFLDSSAFSPSSQRPSSARRPPPSAAANLEARLELKRQQQVATAQQLGGLSSPVASSPANGSTRRPQSSGRDVRA